MTRARSLGVLVLAVAVCAAALWAGGALTRPQIPGWYRDLAKPAFTPPDVTFAIVWPVLFGLMALAAWRALAAAGGLDVRRGREAAGLFVLQLALNVGWSALFFRWHLLGWAFIEVVLLLLAVAACTRAFWRLDRIAGALMLPYLAWVGFAALLTLRIWQLN